MRRELNDSRVLWLWNTDLSLDSLRQDIERVGTSAGVIVSAGWGLRQPFLGSSWLRAIRAVADRARTLGTPLYVCDDERRGRSGSGGGWVTAKEDHRLRALRVREVGMLAPLPDRAEVLVFRIQRDGPWLLRSDFVPPGQRSLSLDRDETFLLFDIVYCADLPRFNGGGAPNPLCDQATDAFLDRVHGPTWAAVSPDTGGALRGFVQGTPTWNLRDEDRGPPLTLPWAVDLGREVDREHQQDLLLRLPELLFRWRDGRHRKLRWAYRETLTRRLNRSYGQKVAKWCADRNLVLTACFEGSGRLKTQVRSTGVVMRQFETVHEPTVAIPLDQQFPLLATLQCASVARMTGRSGGAHFDVTEDATVSDLVWYAEAAMVLGLERRILGPVPQGLRGRRKLGIGLHPGAPIWRFRDAWEDRLRRMRQALGSDEGKTGDVAVLHPIETAWVVSSPRDAEPIDRIDRGVRDVVEALVRGQRGVDLLDEDQLDRIGCVGTGPRICMGSVESGVLVIPPVVRLRHETIRFVERFLDRGGAVVAVRTSARGGLALDPEVAALLRDTRIRPLPLAAVPEMLVPTLDEVAPPEVSVRKPDGSRSTDVWMRVVRRATGPAVCLLSARLARSTVVHVRGVPSRSDDPDEVRIVRLPPGGSAVLETGPRPVDSSVRRSTVSSMPVVRSLQRPASVSVEGVMFQPLGRVRYKIESGPWSEETDFLAAAEQISVRTGHPWDPRKIGAQPWAHARRGVSGRGVGDPERQVGAIGFEAGRGGGAFPLGLSFGFSVAENAPKSIGLLVEDWERWQVCVNGIHLDAPPVARPEEIPTDLPSALRAGWWLDRAMRVRSLASRLTPGFNVVEIHGECLSGTDPQPPALIGELSWVDGVLGPASVREHLGDVNEGDWAPPVGAVVYAWDLSPVPRHGRCRLELVAEGRRPMASGFEVRLDGHFIGAVPWAPYSIDLGNRLADGRPHRLEIVCAGTFGPLTGTRTPVRPHGLGGAPRLFLSEGGS